MSTSQRKATHTPGPWRVGEVRHAYDCIVRNRDNDPVCATMFAGYARPTAEANARLIAAAPDLLVAAKAAWSWCHQGGPADWALIQGFAVLLRAAIQKAEGA